MLLPEVDSSSFNISFHHIPITKTLAILWVCIRNVHSRVILTKPSSRLLHCQHLIFMEPFRCTHHAGRICLPFKHTGHSFSLRQSFILCSGGSVCNSTSMNEPVIYIQKVIFYLFFEMMLWWMVSTHYMAGRSGPRSFMYLENIHPEWNVGRNTWHRLRTTPSSGRNNHSSYSNRGGIQFLHILSSTCTIHSKNVYAQGIWSHTKFTGVSMPDLQTEWKQYVSMGGTGRAPVQECLNTAQSHHVKHQVGFWVIIYHCTQSESFKDMSITRVFGDDAMKYQSEVLDHCSEEAAESNAAVTECFWFFLLMAPCPHVLRAKHKGCTFLVIEH